MTRKERRKRRRATWHQRVQFLVVVLLMDMLAVVFVREDVREGVCPLIVALIAMLALGGLSAVMVWDAWRRWRME